LFCTIPMPLTIPFTEISPNAPAPKTAGGIFESGPVMAGVESAVGAAGAAGVAASAAGAGVAGVCPNADMLRVKRQMTESLCANIYEITPFGCIVCER
jgi:hypothetical protein